MFKKLFGKIGKKNDGFYMQIEEPTAQASTEQAAKTVAPSPVEKVAATPVVAPAAKVTENTEPQAAVPVESDKAKKTAGKDKKTSIKDKKKKKAEKDSPVVAPAPVTVATTTAEPAFTNFATDYLIKPSSNSNRRRPGANMKQFMDMAKQVETKKSPSQRAK